MMDTRTGKALSSSISHWLDNIAAEHPPAINIQSKSCALCLLFLADHCVGCPVAAKTGEAACHGTPWLDASNAFAMWKRSPGDELHRDLWREAAAKEVEFLKSLRDAP